ncbi:MAG TPA: MFS transporter [Bradyrhizobium sp.]|nr:MFS transporter [Bradyrhizobium sp.]
MAVIPDIRSRSFNPLSLDATNFLLADVRGALGPYLNVFLVTQQHWSQTEVGMVTTLGGLLGLTAQTPIGAAIDETRAKRGVVVVALAVLALAAAVIFALPSFWPVMIANSAIAVVGDVFGPAVAALTLGLYAREQLARRMGRNSAFDHAGNLTIAVMAGAVGYALSQRAVFLLVPVFASLAAIAVLSIPSDAIDLGRARDLDQERNASGSTTGATGYNILFKSWPLIIFGLCTMLFHFANAPLLPLVGQKLAAAFPKEATAMMSACIIAAQMVMLPIAMLAGRTADTWGRKPLFLGGFAILPVRALLYTLSDNSFWLIGVQLLDGIGAGIFGALTPLVVADIMRGTGRYNLALGAIATMQGIGASLSGLAAGVIVDHFGYSAAFLTSGAAALVALIFFALAMPETAERGTAANVP